MNGTPVKGALTTTAAPEVNQIATLLIPVSGRHLVLPNVSVAEIIPFRDPVAAEDVPTWFLGFFEWRSSRVPLVSFEAINDEPFAGRGYGRRIAILNNVIDDPNLPFVGVVTEGLPRLLRLVAEEIADDNDLTPGPAELARVYINGERASIPNVPWLQQQVLRVI
jgi:chemosensory pili system protein ChpC